MKWWFRKKSDKPVVMVKDKRDQSTKPFEIQGKEYRWYKYARKLRNEPKWKHYKYYNTMQSATDALRDFRNSWYDKAYYDYPGADREAEFPHIKPTITIHRYKIVKRDL